jgi:hypothetical protein
MFSGLTHSTMQLMFGTFTDVLYAISPNISCRLLYLQTTRNLLTFRVYIISVITVPILVVTVWRFSLHCLSHLTYVKRPSSKKIGIIGNIIAYA